MPILSAHLELIYCSTFTGLRSHLWGSCMDLKQVFQKQPLYQSRPPPRINMHTEPKIKHIKN